MNYNLYLKLNYISNAHAKDTHCSDNITCGVFILFCVVILIILAFALIMKPDKTDKDEDNDFKNKSICYLLILFLCLFLMCVPVIILCAS